MSSLSTRPFEIEPSRRTAVELAALSDGNRSAVSLSSFGAADEVSVKYRSLEGWGEEALVSAFFSSSNGKRARVSASFFQPNFSVLDGGPSESLRL
jgi:hypothetical protein